MDEILKWLQSNCGWVIAIFGLIFEVTPIKFSPISSFLKWIGKRITFELDKKIDNMQIVSKDRYNELKNENENLRYAVDMQRISNIKAVILDFANSCRNGRKHSKEEFTYILSENNEYEELIKRYNLINNVYKEDFAYIKEIYHDCLRENKFLA